MLLERWEMLCGMCTERSSIVVGLSGGNRMYEGFVWDWNTWPERVNYATSSLWWSLFGCWASRLKCLFPICDALIAGHMQRKGHWRAVYCKRILEPHFNLHLPKLRPFRYCERLELHRFFSHMCFFLFIFFTFFQMYKTQYPGNFIHYIYYNITIIYWIDYISNFLKNRIF